MERNVKVRFLKDGKSYRFVFADGINSPVYYSKQAGMNDPDLNKRKENHLIQQIEFEDVIGQIIGAKGIPYLEPKSEEITVMDVIPCDLFLSPGETVQTAFLKRCNCGGNHGLICCQKGAYAIVDNKEDGLVSLDYLREQGSIIFPEEYKKVKKEIEDFFNQRIKKDSN